MVTGVLGRLLAEVRAGGDGHRRADQDAAGQRPWSDADEAALHAIDPWWLRSAAEDLDRARTLLREVGAELGRLAGTAIGPGAAESCARLAASCHGRADAAERLAGELRAAHGRIEDVLDSAARRVLRASDAADRDLPGWPAPGPYTGAPPDRHSGSERYATLLRDLRTELGAVLDALPDLLPARDRSEPPPPGRLPEPGTGPRLPGIEARRIEPGYGVRIARLPDGPPD